MMIAANDPTRSGSAPPAQSAADVCLSLSEIEALCLKAARGAGLSWGEAEEAGWAAAWLARAGLSGPGILVAWLDDLGALGRPVPTPGRWRAPAAPLCPLRTGVALADHAGLAEGPGPAPLCLRAVAHPLLVLPFVARAAARLGHPLRVEWNGMETTLGPSRTGPIPPLAGPAGDGPADLTIARAAAPPPDRPPPGPAQPPAPVALADWQALDARALRITVPPSSKSRAGAGAAKSDND